MYVQAIRYIHYVQIVRHIYSYICTSPSLYAHVIPYMRWYVCTSNLLRCNFQVRNVYHITHMSTDRLAQATVK